LSTLVHEMVHVWQQHCGTPSKRGYHNKEWATKMKSVGPQPSSTGMVGGKETGQRMSHYCNRRIAQDRRVAPTARPSSPAVSAVRMCEASPTLTRRASPARSRWFPTPSGRKCSRRCLKRPGCAAQRRRALNRTNKRRRPFATLSSGGSYFGEFPHFARPNRAGAVLANSPSEPSSEESTIKTKRATRCESTISRSGQAECWTQAGNSTDGQLLPRHSRKLR
jgi:hypothetical protein